LIYSDKKWLAVAGVAGDFLKTQAERLKLSGVKHVALEQNDCSNAIVANKGCDLFVDLTAMKTNSK
jgi:hypothetical protein